MQAAMHERMLELPLFQGMSRSDLADIISTLSFRSLTFAKDKTIVSEGDTCQSLCFHLSGTISTTCRADDGGYSIEERFTAPGIIQPERIFGMTQRYSRTVTAVTPCTFIRIDKSEVLQLAEGYEIFRINLLNMVCTQSQRLNHQPLRTKPHDIRSKITRFITDRCLRPAGEKTVRIKMQRLADEIGESRLNVSRALNGLHSQGIIALRRSEIHVRAIENLRE